MFRKSQFWRRAAAVAAGVTLLSIVACSGGSSGAQSGSATSGNITWWGWTPDAVNAASLIAAFNQKVPRHPRHLRLEADRYL